MTTRSTSLRIADNLAVFNKMKTSASWASRYVTTKGGLNICSNCCITHRSNFALKDSWIIDEDKTNRQLAFKCDNCARLISRLY